MKNKKGFTLTEILLAVMIVGIIGVALASLTTAASRESGVGRSKVLLRNNLSIALRQLRRDIKESSRVLYVSGTLGSIGTTEIPLLMVGKNVDQGDGSFYSATPTFITYCFKRGVVNTTTSGASVLPSGAYDGGVIVRYESADENWISGNIPSCSGTSSSKFLNNVKYIPSSTYAAPLFGVRGYQYSDGSYRPYSVKDSGSLADIRKNLGSVLDVNLVTELPSSPVVNDVTEETFILPNGFGI